VDGSQIEYFSDEFNELCTQVGATPVAADNPLGAGVGWRVMCWDQFADILRVYIGWR